MELSGAALVTGASRGIGRSSALALARRGADVAVGYVVNRTAADAVVDEVTALGRRAVAVQVDAGSPEQLRAAVDAAVEAFGGLRCVVANAANGTFGTCADLTVEQWDDTMAKHSRALLVLAQAAAPALRDGGGGSIVAISSLGASRVFDAYAAFGAAKAAIEQLVRYLAVELGPDGINVNCVSGGVVLTDLFKEIPDWEAIAAASAERSPLRTVMDPDDIGEAVAFFASPGAARITGQTLTADAGFMLPG